jgi:hypothetical protein
MTIDGGGEGLTKHLKYLSYVLRHKWFVFVEACRLGIPWRGLVHDLSKFRPSEWMPYARYFYGDYPEFKTMPTGLKWQYTGQTKEDVDREFDAAWLRHQHRNPHHWQYWVLREDDGGTRNLPMPDAYRREMLADWRGAGRALGKPDTQAWYERNKDKMLLHPETRAWIEEQLMEGGEAG